MTTPQDVLDFWFDGDPSSHRVVWFEKDAAFDHACTRFADALHDAKSGTLDHWAETPFGALALVILLDQFSRNLFRGSPGAYAADGKARIIARVAIAQQFDQQVGSVERVFFYLPFEHSEQLADQAESVRLHTPLGDDAAKWARHHHDIVHRFGRFPHRNAILGRANTLDEERYLASDENKF
ncbi:MAG TPA: DUF924 family protein [Acetobacteraceae bacterium]|jgi:uncharacterized protein (DUF924 family)|nr:DUF924 family protein [Acetobacteraceae bacterium]